MGRIYYSIKKQCIDVFLETFTEYPFLKVHQITMNSDNSDC